MSNKRVCKHCNTGSCARVCVCHASRTEVWVRLNYQVEVGLDWIPSRTGVRTLRSPGIETGTIIYIQRIGLSNIIICNNNNNIFYFDYRKITIVSINNNKHFNYINNNNFDIIIIIHIFWIVYRNQQLLIILKIVVIITIMHPIFNPSAHFENQSKRDAEGKTGVYF